MRINRKTMVLGLVGFGVAAAVAGGVGVAQAAGPGPAPSGTASPFGYGHGAGMHGMVGAQGSCVDAAATYLGLSESDLRAQMQSGKSLAQVAEERGKSVSGLQDAMVAAVKSSLAADTTLTVEQRASYLAQAKSRIAAMIDQAHQPGMGRGHGGGWMHGTQQ
jgi:hypothetical protein